MILDGPPSPSDRWLRRGIRLGLAFGERRRMTVGVGVEPTPFLLNRQAGYRLPDPTMKPTAGVAPASPAYDAGSLLLTYAGKEWKGPALSDEPLARSAEGEESKGAAGAAPAHGGFAGRRVC